LGFPLTVTFLGEDLVLHHALDFSLPLSLIFSFVFVINGISLIRLYAHIFLGRRDAEIQNYSCDLTPMSSFVRLFLFILCNAVPFGLKHYFLR